MLSIDNLFSCVCVWNNFWIHKVAEREINVENIFIRNNIEKKISFNKAKNSFFSLKALEFLMLQKQTK